MIESYDSYSAFAEVYDLFMENVPYEKWRDGILDILHSYEINDGIVADLGCGTGVMTRMLSEAGYDMIGVDYSYDMLSVAMAEPSEGILYLQQDLTEMEFYGTVAAMVSCCDCLNYIDSAKSLAKIFKLVQNYLDPGGIFIFDMNTIHKYKDILGDNTFAENRNEGSFIWENEYDEATKCNRYDLTLYIANNDGSFDRCEETHLQYGYEAGEIEQLAGKAGLLVERIFDADTGGELSSQTERMVFVVRKKK